MKDIFISLKATFWRLLGICNNKDCFKKGTNKIYIPIIKTKRCLCDTHLKVITEELGLKDKIEII